MKTGVKVSFQSGSPKCRISPSCLLKPFLSWDDESLSLKLGRSPEKMSRHFFCCDFCCDQVYKDHHEPQGLLCFWVLCILHKTNIWKLASFRTHLKGTVIFESVLLSSGCWGIVSTLSPTNYSIAVLPSFWRSQIFKLSSCFTVNCFQWNCNLMQVILIYFMLIFCLKTTTNM